MSGQKRKEGESSRGRRKKWRAGENITLNEKRKERTYKGGKQVIKREQKRECERKEERKDDELNGRTEERSRRRKDREEERHEGRGEKNK